MKVLQQVPDTEAVLARELFELTQRMKTDKARSDVLKEHFKQATGDRVHGEFLVSVSSVSKTVIDSDLVRQVLGDRLPEVQVAQKQVQCSVKRLS